MRIPIAFLFCLFCFSGIHAQEPEPLSRTVVKLSPQHFTDNSFKAGTERFNKAHSSSWTFFFTAKLENNKNGSYQYGYDGLAGELQFRKYVRPMKLNTSKKGKIFHQGVYGAAYLQAGSYSGKFTDYYYPYYPDPNTGMPGTPYYYDYQESIGNWGFGFAIGYQRTLWEVIFLEAFLGGGIQFSDRIISGMTPPPTYYSGEVITDPAYKGIMPKIGLNVGLGL